MGPSFARASSAAWPGLDSRAVLCQQVVPSAVVMSPGVILAAPAGSLWESHGRPFSAQVLGGKHMLTCRQHVVPAGVLRWSLGGPWVVSGAPLDALCGFLGGPL